MKRLKKVILGGYLIGASLLGLSSADANNLEQVVQQKPPAAVVQRTGQNITDQRVQIPLSQYSNKLGNLKNLWGTNLFTPENITRLYDLQTEIETVKKLVDFKQDGSYHPLFYSGDKIVKCFDDNLSLQQIQSVANLKSEGYKIFCDSDSIIDYLKVGGTADFAEKIMASFNKHDCFSNDGKILTCYKKAGGTIDYAKKMSKYLSYSCLPSCFEQGVDEEYASEILGIKDDEGNTVFFDKDLSLAKEVGLKKDEAKKLLEKKGKDGKALCDASNIMVIVSNNENLEDIVKEISEFEAKGINFGINDVVYLRREKVPKNLVENILSYDELNWNAATIAEFHKQGGTLKLAKQFRGIGGINSRNISSLVNLPIEYIDSIREVSDKIYASDIIKFYELNVKPDELIAFLELGNGLFSVYKVGDYLKAGGTYSLADTLINSGVTDEYIITRLAENGLTIDKLAEYRRILGSGDMNVITAAVFNKYSPNDVFGLSNLSYFDEEYVDIEIGLFPVSNRNSNLITFMEKCIRPEFAKQLLDIKDKKGNSIFKCPQNILEFIDMSGLLIGPENDQIIEQITHIANYLDDDGRFIYPYHYIVELHKTNGFSLSDIVELCRTEKTKEDIDFLFSLSRFGREVVGEDLFTHQMIANFNLRGRKYAEIEQYIKEFCFKYVQADAIYRFNQLGIGIDEAIDFQDTEKPNLLMIYAVSDWNGAFEEFSEYDSLRSCYDIRVKVANDESDVTNALDKTDSIDVLMFWGHGQKTSLKLSDKFGEEYNIDVSDIELKDHLKNLNHDAIIVLNSCCTAEGGKNEDNLANFLHKISGGKTIYAPTKPTNFKEFTSLYPMAVRFRPVDEKDVTYVARD